MIIVTQQIADEVFQKFDISENLIRILSENGKQWRFGSFYMYSGELKLASLYPKYPLFVLTDKNGKLAWIIL